MVDWCHLPQELLDLIADRLDSSIDLLRFRSVCNSWRSSTSPKPHYDLPSRFPILPNDGISDPDGFYLFKRTIFRLGVPESHRTESFNDWIIMAEENASKKMQLLNPLFSGAKLGPFPASFPKILDFYDLRCVELGEEYVLKYLNSRPYGNAIGDSYMEKVALSWGSDGSYVVLTIHISGKLAVFRSGDEFWYVVDDMISPYDDVILFEERFYAVDNTGRAVVVEIDPTPSVTEIAGSVYGGDKKCLVECEGKLLLVDIYLSIGPLDDSSGNGYDSEDVSVEFPDVMSERMVKLRVYELDWGDPKWVEVKSLGNKILFLGDNCTFSASACDFPGSRGNCIYFTGNCFSSSREEDADDDDIFNGRRVSVFSLDDGSFYSLATSQDQGYLDLFWPPPSWVMSTSLTQNVINNVEHGSFTDKHLVGHGNMEKYPTWMKVSFLFVLFSVLKRSISWILE